MVWVNPFLFRVDDQWAYDGTRGFIIEYVAENYNDTEIFGRYPVNLGPLAQDKSAEVNMVSLRYEGQVGAVIPIGIGAQESTASEVYVGTVVTTLALQYHSFGHLVIPVAPQRFANPDAACFLAWPSNYAAADDAYITVSGKIKNTPTGPSVDAQPVTLEGYKWPLTKRRA